MYGFSYGLMFIIPITCMFVFAFGFVGWRKKYPLPYYCMVVLGVVYVNYAIAYAFFPIDFWDVPGFSVKNNINFTLNLFSSDNKHLVLNMLLTLPMGMGMQFVTNMKNIYRFLVVILLSFLIEIVQLIILLAFQPIDVFFDINDMFCNVAGGAFVFGIQGSLLATTKWMLNTIPNLSAF